MDNIKGADGGLCELALFAGAGGGILGGHLLGWRTVCAVEYEPYAAGVLISRQNDGILPPFPIWDDVRTFDGKPWRGIVDVVSGGFPCQDISSAGRGAGISGERSGLWSEMARIIGEVRPRFAFVENSPILTSRGLGRVLGDLAALGYDAEWCVLGAADVGAPHKRDRIWILAHTESQRHGTRRESRNIREENGGPEHGLRPEPACTGAQAGILAHAERPEWGTQLCACDGLAGVHGVPQREEGPSGLRARGQILALATGERCGETGIDRSSQPAQRATGCGTDVADTASIGQQGSRESIQRGNKTQDRKRKANNAISISEFRQWPIEPDVGRVANGVAARVDRLKAIGNGQVPAVAAAAFRLLHDRLRGLDKRGPIA